MNDVVRIVLLGVLLLGAAIWLGGFVTLIMAARSASATLPPAERVAFFRHFGRRFGTMSTCALVASLIAGGVLLAEGSWDGLSMTILVLALLLILILAMGVVQARRMTRLRSRAVQSPEDQSLTDRVARGSKGAVVLRASIGVISFALFAVALIRAV